MSTTNEARKTQYIYIVKARCYSQNSSTSKLVQNLRQYKRFGCHDITISKP